MGTPIPVSQVRFSVEELLQITGGELSLDLDDLTFQGVSSDSRNIPEGGVFVALLGERFDGHRFVTQALESGAAVAMVQRDRSEELTGASDLPLLWVNDTLVALGALAAFHRERWGGSVVAITGSVGKTTTKELTAAAVSVLAKGAVVRTHGNLNNRIGVPHTLLTLTEGASHAVIEAGTSLPGEIPALGAMIAPDVSVVTAVKRSHANGFPDLEDLADEKAALFRTARPAGCLVANRDDARVWERAVALNRRVVSFGRSAEADVCLRGRTAEASMTQQVRITVEGAVQTLELEVRLALLGEGAALSAAMAVAALVALEPELTQATLEAAARAMERVAPPAGRLEVARGSFGGWVLDDSYNASPASMRHAMSTALELMEHRSGRVFVAMGDMLDLAEETASAHERLAQETLSLPIEHVVVLGDAMHAAFQNLTRTTRATDHLSAVNTLQSMLGEGDLLLVKGSRGMVMERIVSALRAPEGGASSLECASPGSRS